MNLMRNSKTTRAVLAAALLFLFVMGVIAVSIGVAPPANPFVPRPLPTLSPQGHNTAINENQRRNRPVQALYHVEALAARVGWTPDLHQQAGDLWQRLGDNDRALFHWRQAALAGTDDVLLLRAIAEVQLSQEDWSSATDTLTRLLAIQAENTWANYHLGMLRAPVNPTVAELHLRQAALDPLYNEAARAVRITIIEGAPQANMDETRLPMLIGLTMIEQEQWAYAELAFEHANALALTISGEPLPEALAYQSLSQDRQGKSGEDAIVQAVRLRPDDPQIRYLLGLHLRSAGDLAGSLEALIQAATLSPTTPALYAELGTAYRLIGDLQAAERWYQTALSISNSAPEYQRVLALFYAEEAYNLGSSGVESINQALGVMPNDPDLLAGLGWALFNEGDVVAGQQQVEAALAIDPNNPRALFYKAQILLATGEDDALAFSLLEEVAAGNSTVSTEASRILEAR